MLRSKCATLVSSALKPLETAEISVFGSSGCHPYELQKLCRKIKWRVDHNIRFLRVELYDLRRFRGLHFLFWLSCCFYVWFFVVRLL